MPPKAWQSWTCSAQSSHDVRTPGAACCFCVAAEILLKKKVHQRSTSRPYRFSGTCLKSITTYSASLCIMHRLCLSPNLLQSSSIFSRGTLTKSATRLLSHAPGQTYPFDHSPRPRWPALQIFRLTAVVRLRGVCWRARAHLHIPLERNGTAAVRQNIRRAS